MDEAPVRRLPHLIPPVKSGAGWPPSHGPLHQLMRDSLIRALILRAISRAARLSRTVDPSYPDPSCSAPLWSLLPSQRTGLGPEVRARRPAEVHYGVQMFANLFIFQPNVLLRRCPHIRLAAFRFRGSILAPAFLCWVDFHSRVGFLQVSWFPPTWQRRAYIVWIALDVFHSPVVVFSGWNWCLELTVMMTWAYLWEISDEMRMQCMHSNGRGQGLAVNELSGLYKPLCKEIDPCC